MSRISVIIPLYNKRPYIHRALRSALRQSLPPAEIIVVDDGSTDGGADLVERAALAPVRLIRQPNSGAAAARNAGVLNATGNLLAFLDADDEWEPDFLAAVAALSARYPTAGLYATGCRRILNMTSARSLSLRPPGQLLLTNYFSLAAHVNLLTSSSVAIPRSTFASTGLFDVTCRIAEDLDLWVRIALRFPIAYDTRLLANYHMEADGRAMCSTYSGPPYPPAITQLRTLLRSPHVLPQELHTPIGRYVDEMVMRYAYQLLWERRPDDARRYLRSEAMITLRGNYHRSLLLLLTHIIPSRYLVAAHTYRTRVALRLSERFLLTRRPAVSITDRLYNTDALPSSVSSLQ
jgi:glycosyltransferase involved in cell wall biosynthesis